MEKTKGEDRNTSHGHPKKRFVPLIVFTLFTILAIVLAVYSHYSPTIDVKVESYSVYVGETLDSEHQPDPNYDFVSFRFFLSNRGSIQHTPDIACVITFQSQPSQTIRYVGARAILSPHQEDVGPCYIEFMVPKGIIQYPYDTSCYVLPGPLIDQGNYVGWLVLGVFVAWPIGLAALVLSLRRGKQSL
jgi:hypothetical protein